MSDDLHRARLSMTFLLVKRKAQSANYSNRFATELGRIKLPLTNRRYGSIEQNAIACDSLDRSNVALFIHAHFDQHFSLRSFGFRRQNRIDLLDRPVSKRAGVYADDQRAVTAWRGALCHCFVGFVVEVGDCS